MIEIFNRYLTSGLPGDTEICLRSSPHKTTIDLIATHKGRDMWRSKLSFNFTASEIALLEMFVCGEFRRRGISRQLLANSLSLGAHLGLRRAWLRATGLGRYVWALMGYLPTSEAWNGILRPKYKQLLAYYEEFDNECDCDNARETLASEDPASFGVIADILELVRCAGSTEHLSGRVPLGAALLIEGPDWSGSREVPDIK